MTTEQKEAVALVKDFTKMDFNNPMGWTGYYDTELKELQQAIETVLNLIQEKDKEIEKYKKLYQKALDDAVVTAHYNMQKDKIIDLMAKQIDILMNTNNEELDCFIPTDFSNINDCVKKKSCEDCIKNFLKLKQRKENKHEYKRKL